MAASASSSNGRSIDGPAGEKGMINICSAPSMASAAKAVQLSSGAKQVAIETPVVIAAAGVTFRTALSESEKGRKEHVSRETYNPYQPIKRASGIAFYRAGELPR